MTYFLPHRVPWMVPLPKIALDVRDYFIAEYENCKSDQKMVLLLEIKVAKDLVVNRRHLFMAD